MDQKPLSQPKSRKRGHFRKIANPNPSRKFTFRPRFNAKISFVARAEGEALCAAGCGTTKKDRGD